MSKCDDDGLMVDEPTAKRWRLAGYISHIDSLLFFRETSLQQAWTCLP